MDLRGEPLVASVEGVRGGVIGRGVDRVKAMSISRTRIVSAKNENNRPNVRLFLNGPNPVSFLFIFDVFTNTNLAINDKRVDGVLRTRTRGGRMEGADESTKL